MRLIPMTRTELNERLYRTELYRLVSEFLAKSMEVALIEVDEDIYPSEIISIVNGILKEYPDNGNAKVFRSKNDVYLIKNES